jgi:hypothetical protein
MEKQYVKKGQVANAAIGSIIALVVGVGIVTIVVIFISVLGGQTYTLNQTSLGTIANSQISSAINASILAGFTTLETTTGYVPLIVLAVIIFIVLTLVLGFTAFSGNTGMGGGSAL